MGEREIIVPVAELNRLELFCPDCQVSATVTVAESAKLPERCSACGKEFGNGLGEALRGYRRFYTLLEALKARVQFRVQDKL